MPKIIDTRLNDFSLPVHISSDNEYINSLDNVLCAYSKHIHSIIGLQPETVKKTDSNIEAIKNILKLYFNGYIGDAITQTKLIIRDYVKEPYFVSDFDKSYAFRGIAPIKMLQKKFGYDKAYSDQYKKMNETPISLFRGRISKEVLDKEDMLHIPYNLREKVSTQRYSMSGIPCMYLTTSSLGSYLELGNPNYKDFYLSSFQIESNNVKLLNLCITQHTINGAAAGYVEDYEIQHISNLIEIFPLVIASSFVVDTKNERNFKTEYIIPQLIMMAINDLGIDAVAYLSVQMSDSYSYPHCVNIALPMKSASLYRKYSEFCNEIKFTKSTCFDDCLIPLGVSNSHSYINEIYNENDSNSKVEINNNICVYQDTIYSKVDDILVSQPHTTIKMV